MHRLVCLMAAVFGLAGPARAYMDATPPLSRLIKDATHIAVLQVTKVHREKGLILFKNVPDLWQPYGNGQAEDFTTIGN